MGVKTKRYSKIIDLMSIVLMSYYVNANDQLGLRVNIMLEMFLWLNLIIFTFSLVHGFLV